uniref:Uncharacterized protein n=1 Tax=Trypanosoma congolense (strain IL3000) TaxID=1068625 RepID=G0UT57_TRYCI|nr:hypothetical protein, unlikely [Trypanosoma congolense IL3000]
MPDTKSDCLSDTHMNVNYSLKHPTIQSPPAAAPRLTCRAWRRWSHVCRSAGKLHQALKPKKPLVRLRPVQPFPTPATHTSAIKPVQNDVSHMIKGAIVRQPVAQFLPLPLHQNRVSKKRHYPQWSRGTCASSRPPR